MEHRLEMIDNGTYYRIRAKNKALGNYGYLNEWDDGHPWSFNEYSATLYSSFDEAKKAILECKMHLLFNDGEFYDLDNVEIVEYVTSTRESVKEVTKVCENNRYR